MSMPATRRAFPPEQTAASPSRRKETAVRRMPLDAACSSGNISTFERAALSGATLLLLQRIDVLVEANFRGRGIDEMKVDLAAGFQRPDGLAGKAERGGELVRIDRLVLRLHFLESPLEQHVGGVIALLVVRRPAGERRRSGDLLGLEDGGLVGE